MALKYIFVKKGQVCPLSNSILVYYEVCIDIYAGKGHGEVERIHRDQEATCDSCYSRELVCVLFILGCLP